MSNCVTCKHGEKCNKYVNHIHCNLHNVSLTKMSKCTKWEAKNG